MDIGPTELIIILIIVILLFGVGRISKIAGELGSGIKAFREGLTDAVDEKQPPQKVEQAEKPVAEDPIDAKEDTAAAKDA